MRRNWSDVKCFSCGKPGHSANRCPTLDVTFPFILPGWKAEKTPTGYLMISPKMAMDRRRAEQEESSGGRGSPLGSVIRTDPMIPVEGEGSIRFPTPQNVMNRNLPMDTNKNRYEKLVQTPFWGAEVANPNSITFEQKVKTTAAEVCWNLSDKTEPSRCQETAVAAEGAGTGATTDERDRSIDCIKSSTTGQTLATKCDGTDTRPGVAGCD